MIHHPIILVPKLVVLVVIVVVLTILHGSLTSEQFRTALIISGCVFVCFTIAIWIFGYKILSNPESRITKALTLSAPVNAEDGSAASSNELKALVGVCGETVSALRPSGMAIINGERVSVVTSGEFMPQGVTVEVVAVRGSEVLVKAAPDEANQNTSDR
ncbi:MAG: hypothetical protein HN350_05705 [Phycisphaerales bacterium]|jgi:membrane-bound ClpP family serine protease|nr:hypothetical protein [Phycisphaerales bacterium]